MALAGPPFVRDGISCSNKVAGPLTAFIAEDGAIDAILPVRTYEFSPDEQRSRITSK